MYKNFLKTVTMMGLVLILSNGCSETSSESAGTVKNIETAEVIKSDGFAIKEKCKLNPPAEPIACTMQYDPVCGCDNKTYGNACMARGAGVPSSTPGACEESANNE